MLSATAAMKKRSASALIKVPVRAPGRPVTMPAIAITSKTTATRAKRAATTRTDPNETAPSYPGSPPLHVLPVHLHDLQALPALSPGPGGAHGHLPVVPAR